MGQFHDTHKCYRQLKVGPNFSNKMIYINTLKLKPKRPSILYNNVTYKLLFVGSWVPPKTMPSNPMPQRRGELRVKVGGGGGGARAG